MTPLIAAISPFCLGLACFVFAIRLRRGSGGVQVARRVRVDYARLPLSVRARASDVNLMLGASFLAFAAGGLSPGPFLLVPFVLCLLLCHPYYVRHKALKTAAEETMGTHPTDLFDLSGLSGLPTDPVPTTPSGYLE
jgi:hypothetical protein